MFPVELKKLKKLFCKDNLICEFEEIKSVEAIKVVENIERKNMAVCLKDDNKKIKAKKNKKLLRRTKIKN